MILKGEKINIFKSILWFVFFINFILISAVEAKDEDVIIWEDYEIEKSKEGFIGKDTKSKEQKTNITKLKKTNHYTISIGSYARGVWDMRPLLNGTNYCSVWTLCSELEGINFNFTHTNLLLEKGKYSFDLDKSLTFSWQGTDNNMKNKKIEYKESFFTTLALVPHFRVNKISNNFPLGVGVGLGPVISFGDIVVQEPHDYGPIMSRVNFELTYPFGKEKETSIVFGINHDCSFFGMLAPEGTPQYSHSWYSIGMRKKI